MVGLLWLSLPICLPDCFTFSLVNRLGRGKKKHKSGDSRLKTEDDAKSTVITAPKKSLKDLGLICYRTSTEQIMCWPSNSE